MSGSRWCSAVVLHEAAGAELEVVADHGRGGGDFAERSAVMVRLLKHPSGGTCWDASGPFVCAQRTHRDLSVGKDPHAAKTVKEEQVSQAR